MKTLLAILALLVAFVAPSASAQNTYSAYINSDGSAATGCTISLPGGTFVGAEWRVQASATTGSSPQVTGVTLAQCSGGVFGAGTSVGGSHAVGLNNGTAGSDVVEFSTPNTGVLGGSYSAPMGFVAQSAGGSDVLFSIDGGNGVPIVLGRAVPTPTLGAGALALLALLLLLIGRRQGRGRLYSRVMGLSLFALSGIALAATLIDDGQVGDWAGISAIATDPAGDPTNGSPDIDIRAAFVVDDGSALRFRLDVTDMQTSAPTITSGNSATFVVGTAGTFNVSATGIPAPALGMTCAPALPGGVTFTDNLNGTGTLAGTPPAGSAGTYNCTLTASNGVPPDATQAFTLTIVTQASTTTLGADINPTVFGQSVTFTAAVAAVPPGSGTPTGTVNFFDGATNIGNGTLNGAGVATLTTSALSVATHAIAAQYAGDVNFGPSTSAAVNQIVGKAATTTALVSGTNPSVFSQSVTFTATVAATAPGTGTPTGNVNFFDGAINIGTVTLAAGTALLTTSALAVGTHPITATYAGDASFVSSTSAPAVNQVVNQVATTTALVADINPSAYQQNVKFTATVTANPPGSGTPAGTVNFLDGASNIGAAALNGSGIASLTINSLSVTTHSITAVYAGNTNYATSTSAAVSQVVNQATQTITFTSTAPSSAVVGGATYLVTATGGASGNPVTFTIDASATSVCSIAGSTVTFLAFGTCVIDANQAGNANYSAAAQAQQSFAVGKNNQTITFTSTAPASAVVGGATYPVTATGGASGNPVTFTIDASATSVCSIAGSTVTFLAFGTCVIDANQAGDANYNAAPQVQQSFAVSKGNQTISFSSTAPVGAVVNGATYAVTASASSGLPVALSIDASATAVCSISASTVSFTAAGNCVIDANQAGDASYNAAPPVQQSFAVGPGSQTISFTSTAPAPAQVGGASYNVTASATSGLPVTLSIYASAASVCSLTGSTVTFTAAGSCVIDANQAGNANYTAAALVQQSFSVAKGDQTITFTSTPPPGVKVNDATYTVTATSSAGLTVTLSLDASSTGCALAGNSVTFPAGGTCVIDANQAGDANYNPASQVQQTFVVAKLDQTITFTSTVPAAKVGGATYTVTATASSGLPVTFSNGSAACTVAGSTVSFVHANTCIVNADQAGNAQYNAALQAQQSFAVAKGDQTINVSSIAPTFGSANNTATPHTYNVSATATSGLTISVSVTGACTSAGTTVSFGPGAGTCTINVDQAGDADWNAATQVQQSTTVEIPASAAGDSHAVTGNVAIAATGSVMSNDSGTAIAIRSYGVNGTEQTSIGTATPTAQGGTVTLAAAGTYNYDPPANFTGTDTFKYIIGNDLTATSTGTVTLTVSDRIIVVSSGAPAGASCKPVAPTPCRLSEADALAAPTGKDMVFVQSGNYTNPNASISLNPNQTLVGNAVSLVQAISDATITLAPESVTLATINAGATPVLSNNNNVITLGGGNLVEYFSITNSAGSAILGNAAGSGTSTIHDIAVTDGANAGNGVNISANVGTLNFSNLVVATSSGNAFAATGAGTINATTGTVPNMLTSTTGRALNVANTTIGASNLNFQSINAGTAASGPINGIVLNNTGTTGGLKVTGIGTTAGSGGTIQRSSGPNVLLTNTANVSLKYMNINAGQDDGIHGENVTNLDLIGCVLADNGNSTADDGIQMGLESGATVGVSGVLNITSTSVTNSAHNNVHIRNTSGTLAMTVSASAFNNAVGPTSANAFLIEASGTSTLAASTISTSSFLNSSPQRALEVQAHDTATIAMMTVSANTFTNNGIHASFTQDTAANLSFKMLNNLNMTGSVLQAINVFSSAASTGGNINGTISGNTIGNAGTAGSGSTQGSGLAVTIQGRTTSSLLIDSNTIRQVGLTSGSRGMDIAYLGPQTTGLPVTQNDITVTNNFVQTDAPGSAFPLAAIFIGADNQGSPARVRADIRNNTVPATGTFDYPGFDGVGGAQLAYAEVTPGAEAQLVDNAPASTDAQAELSSHNTGLMYGDSAAALIPGPITTPP